jgi:hypothetical protein
MLTAPEPETLPLKEAEAEVGVITVTTGLLLLKPKVLAEATEAAATNREARTMCFIVIYVGPIRFRDAPKRHSALGITKSNRWSNRQSMQDGWSRRTG